MTSQEFAGSLRNLTRELEQLAYEADFLQPGPQEHALRSCDILRGHGQLRTISFAPGYRDATIHVTMEAGQHVQICLSVQDSLRLHEELTNMIEVAGSRPLDARP